ncbi:uncharacterized protein J4E79_000849 [Alternaria viburni]|uniref:uncharacterized protein n=1 Tax=Alternaria viburni TaxID=566460 RepID=UPI0020C1C9BE|nr:uncharacterized protein J4E79_000849 [Alternaria viburni]KAI4670566.1 hypothetical protein J4E79_000849 [Alternaria viburni]
MISSLLVSRDESSSLSRRWTEIVTMTGQPRTVWPDGLVRYCFEDESARNNFKDDIDAAWKLWVDKIGEPGCPSGHILQFREYRVKEGVWPYCYNKREKDEDPWVWNKHVKNDIAVIAESKDTETQASSVTGYIPKEWSDEQGRHGIHLGLSFKQKYPPDYWITTVAHELGHLFGFWHEHQREDRNDYVHFDCSKLRGYAAAKAKVDAAKEHTMEQVCADYRLALQYDFPAVQDYDTIDHIAPLREGGIELPLYINSDLEFDDESIMLYTSAEFANDGANTDDVLQVPLAFWKHRGVGFDPPNPVTKDDLEIIDVRWKVSDGDADGVRHLYPYVDSDEEMEKRKRDQPGRRTWIEWTSEFNSM